MTFKVLKKMGEIHFDHNGIDDYDGDDGYYVDIEVPDERVENDLLDMEVSSYIKAELSTDEYQRICKVIKGIFDDYDMWDTLRKIYADKLQALYETEYNHD